jgi:DNA-binding IclR family transcriptional regulator
VQVIELLAEQAEGSAVTAVAQRLNIPASAAHRLLITLAETGIAEQDEQTKHYRLTLAFPALGLRYLSSFTFMEICRPVMDALAEQTRELVRLAIVDRANLIWIAKTQGSRSSLRIDPLEGRSAILHVTAAGKAWLASLPNEQAKKLVRLRRPGAGRAAPYGPRAIQTADALIEDLEMCRRRGYGLTYDEAELGVTAVGAVIRNGSNATAAAVGTISVAGPSARLKRKDLEQMAEPVMEAARRLSEIWPATSHL